MGSRLFFYAAAAASGLVFTGFTLLVKADVLKKADFDLLTKLQYKIPHSFDYLFSVLEILGRFELTSIALIIIFALRKRLLFALTAGAVFVGVHFVEIIGKVYLTQPPPPFMFYRLENVIHLPALYTPDTSSYPSGHAMRSAYIAVLLVFLLKDRITGQLPRLLFTVSLLALPVVIGFSKIMLGAHWPTDIVGGLLLGAGAACLVLAIDRKNITEG